VHPAALLDLAAELLGELLRFQAPADGVVAAFFRRHRQLGARERHALAETAYAVLRERLLLQHLAQSEADGAAPATLQQRLAALAWRGDEAVLARALGVGAQAWRARALARDRSGLPAALQHHLPDWIAQPLAQQLGEAGLTALAAALLQPAPLDLRVNLLRARREAVQAALAAAGVECAPTPYSPWGLRVAGKPALQRSAPYLRGDFEVQDEGSQLLALLTGARRGETVVDFCAGAGGKTLALGAMMRNTGRLYALDVGAGRLAALAPRLQRAGLANVYPMALAHERDERVQRLADKADRVLVDAPCSGLGTLRRSPDLKWRQSAQAVRELAAKQAAILAAAAALVRPGGRLVYATCSLLPAENDEIAAGFGREHPGFRPLPAAEALRAGGVAEAEALVDGDVLRLWPQRHGCDGYYAALWQRR
jgi:16S rRNA (cytosine967-C5)-methyltransferase